MPFKYRDPVERLAAWSIVNENGCWIWFGSHNNTGRPRIAVRVNGKSKWMLVNRFIVKFVHGEALKKQHRGLHNCHNKQCVNPDHIRRGTTLQNNRDTVKAGNHVCGYRVRQLRLQKRQKMRRLGHENNSHQFLCHASLQIRRE